MKIASITLPKPQCSNDPLRYAFHEKQRGLQDGHGAIIATLSEFGGYSRLKVRGCYINARGEREFEDSYRYEFTSPDTQTARDELVALAYRIKTISDEEAIFIVHANGNAEIVR